MNSQTLLVLLLLSIVGGGHCLNNITRPKYPEQFMSNWTYTLAGPQEVISSGWTLWAGYNQSLYYYMSALEGWEQILTGTRIYNFYRSQANCCFDDYGWPLFEDYFNNATFVGYVPGNIHTYTAQWVGSLYTQSVFGSNVTYFVATEPDTGFPVSYIAANVVDYNQSEIMYRFNISYEQPPEELFQIPSFCFTASPCSH